MNKAVFLDRDGVLNKEQGYVYKLEDFELLDDTIAALNKLQENGFLLIVITNQGGIAKGLYDHSDVQIIHDKLEEILNENNISLTAIYYCPHHSDLENCLCRKPDSLMVEKAIARYDIDVTHSYFIGDHARDVAAGEKAGLTSILIESNSSLLHVVSKFG